MIMHYYGDNNFTVKVRVRITLNFFFFSNTRLCKIQAVPYIEGLFVEMSCNTKEYEFYCYCHFSADVGGLERTVNTMALYIKKQDL